MEYLRKLIEFINSLGDDIFDDNVYIMDSEDEDDSKSFILTVHSNDDGNVVFNTFSIEQWEMMDDICELTGKDKFNVIEDLCSDGEIESWIVDPKEFPDDLDKF